MTTPTRSTTVTLGDLSAGSVATLTVSAPSIEAALAAALQGVLDTARSAPVGGAADPGDGAITAPIRGQGSSFGEALYELANDLLAQLDSNGTGLTAARLDGVLATDDGGYTAWGAVTGEGGGGRAAQGLTLDGTPTVAEADGAVSVALRLVRS